MRELSITLTDLTSLLGVGVDCCRDPGVVGRCMFGGRGEMSLARGGCDADNDVSTAEVVADVSKIGQSAPVSSVPSASSS